MNRRGRSAPAETRRIMAGAVVRGIDAAAHSLMLEHEPIDELNWPAMTMAFKVMPELLDNMAVGDKVAFDLELKDGSAEIMAIAEM